MSDKKVILVLDDKPNTIGNNIEIFKRQGCIVVLARTPEDVKSQFHSKTPNLCIIYRDTKGFPKEGPINYVLLLAGKSIPIIMLYNPKAPPSEDEKKRFPITLPRYVDEKRLTTFTAQLLGVPHRTAVRILLQVKLIDQSGKSFFGHSVNVSEGGLLLETNSELNIGDKLNLGFMLPSHGEGMIQTVSEVVRVDTAMENRYRYGVVFSAISDSDRTFIRSFVQEQLEKHR